MTPYIKKVKHTDIYKRNRLTYDLNIVAEYLQGEHPNIRL